MSEGARQSNAALTTVTYTTTATYPLAKPTATIYMDGLLGLCFNGSQRCTIGVNKQAGHLPAFEIWKRTKTTCEPVAVNLPASYQRVEIKVNKLSPPADPVQVYTGPSRTDPNEERHNLESLWVDLEGVRGHGQPVKNKPGMLWPRFYINDGLFTAYKRSTGIFELTDDSRFFGSVDLQEVALAIAVDIFLVAGESIEITADGNALSPPVRLDFGARYEIGITNICASTVGTNDFHLHYGALDVSGLPSPAYTLVNSSGTGSTERTRLGPCVKGGTLSPASDRTPCMPVIFGQTTDFID